MLLCASGCGIKTAQLPFLDYPYAAQIGFYQEVKNNAGKLEKERFKDNRVTSPFYFVLEVKDVENSGKLTVNFYDKDGNRAARNEFSYGEDGQYYEYILFFDKVESLKSGEYRYAIFLKDKLIYEDHITISE